MMKIKNIVYSIALISSFIVQAMEKQEFPDIEFRKTEFEQLDYYHKKTVQCYSINAIFDNKKSNRREIGSISYSEDSTKPYLAYVDDLKVLETFQKRGIGSELLIRALDDLKKRDKEVVEWYSNDSVTFYVPFGAKALNQPIQNLSNGQYSADMEFNFALDGDPRENKHRFKMLNKSIDIDEDVATYNIWCDGKIESSFLRYSCDDY